MFRSPFSRFIAAYVAALVVLGVLHYRPWKAPAIQALVFGARNRGPKELLKVGFLPVT